MNKARRRKQKANRIISADIERTDCDLALYMRDGRLLKYRFDRKLKEYVLISK